MVGQSSIFTIHIFDRDTKEFEDIEFNENNLLSFGIFNRKDYNKDGTFKKIYQKSICEIK